MCTIFDFYKKSFNKKSLEYDCCCHFLIFSNFFFTNVSLEVSDGFHYFRSRLPDNSFNYSNAGTKTVKNTYNISKETSLDMKYLDLDRFLVEEANN